ncbi:MAG: DUF3078 domain-containing protein [Candidatus Eisenbacteria bacterium]|uniref:DUF3078 domain-containing protein n=1 Tax=Eiseniibacteriota bacterium TaxID=2212470 RepID=A0A948RX99_UNCEI|nr:DUF3078 domain-containing protein [Candidatus Eisenbacteria bacterium]MBU1949519.1 DUF3078 domain-containing protein [Candidatus Eisenbacteria bacterium]MBU2692550.1 DUF3078 domain-containing protein [Candidatus Eisenbacteria bacterium]
MKSIFRVCQKGFRIFGLVLLVAAAGLQNTQAEEKEIEVGKWYPTLESGITMTQSSYSDNWSGGDEGSIVWTFITNATLENQLNPKTNWNNELKLAYGQTLQQSMRDNGEKKWDRPEKSTDLLSFETIFRFTMGWAVDPFISGRFESQFQDASDPCGRTLALNPLKFKESVGFARHFINEEERSLLSRFGFALRQNSRKLFVQACSNAPSLSNETKSETSMDGGIEWVTDYNTKILENRVSWTSKLTLYQPIFYSGNDKFDDLSVEMLEAAGLASDIGDFTTVIDADWENVFTTQITKLISVNLYMRWIYDKYDNSVPPVLTDDGGLKNPADIKAAVRKSGQFKETLALGLTYRFF